MGIAFKDLITAQEISLDDLSGKILAVDTYNMLYQFLTTIRSRDGSMLMDSKGNVTSHLVGLFSRATRLMSHGLKLAFVFDGKPPALKQKERERRAELKQEAEEKYKEALAKEDVEEMHKYASRSTRLTPDMVEEAKKLLDALGLPIIQAPSEGEAQCSYLVKTEKAYAVVSQDFDSLIHGTPRLVRNLSIVGKRKKANKLAYEAVKPEIINLSDNLNNLGLDLDQLIVIAILIGTDYNTGGIKGIGPKNALKLVKKHNKDFDAMFKEAKWGDFFSYSWKDVFDTIQKMPVADNVKLQWKPTNINKVMDVLVAKHDFSEERVKSSLENLDKEKEKQSQKGLGDFL